MLRGPNRRLCGVITLAASLSNSTTSIPALTTGAGSDRVLVHVATWNSCVFWIVMGHGSTVCLGKSEFGESQSFNRDSESIYDTGHRRHVNMDKGYYALAAAPRLHNSKSVNWTVWHDAKEGDARRRCLSNKTQHHQVHSASSRGAALDIIRSLGDLVDASAPGMSGPKHPQETNSGSDSDSEDD